ncbi:PTB domain-containing engulfment adapter protein 1-like isoform X2 [Gigantopelta aegis]|uniref:PTB domain-containing engulfment adapter protein 1-like isoform X2 n=1 Tax=Gigantopelta aegis TaxID=1735272 RepID=UPI001B8881CE|nr:PTB domain-containing engulfment adapter protein 1-like isoform X2 [Gigantopelta aegis]
MDAIKVAKDYFVSSQSTLLIENRDFGSRKFLSVGLPRTPSGAKIVEKALTKKEKSDVPSPPPPPDILTMKSGNKQWVHPPEALLRGHILYNVKFLGECSVDQPKGTDVVKEAIRKMKFNKHIKRAEGHKPPKVELTISADGVTVQDPKTKMIMHQYPLHRISYCADDKSDKRMFTFIAKGAQAAQHSCYVFDSEKCSEEITLTVGQAFDLAYRRFLESSSKDMDFKKQFLVLQKKVQTLQFENDTLKGRIGELEKMKNRSDVEQYKANNQPQRQTSLVGRRLENLIFDEEEPQTNGTADRIRSQTSEATPILSPPPPSSKSRGVLMPGNRVGQQITTSPASQQPQAAASFNPFAAAGASSSDDPFGMGKFNPSTSDLDRAINNVDQELLDLQTGFSRGLSIGTDDFSLDDLDPLNQKL